MKDFANIKRYAKPILMFVGKLKNRIFKGEGYYWKI